MFKRIKFCSVLLVLSAFCISDVQACTKPVFRYALERWPASPYRLAVLHKGPIDDATRGPVDALIPKGTYNLFVDYFDVNEELPEGVVREKWLADPSPARLPLALLLPPVRVQTEEPILWEGRVDSAGIEKLRSQLYGPVVRQLLEKLASGDTAVWILVKDSDEAKNRESRALLEKTLSELKDELKLPHELDPTDSEYDDGLAPGIPMRTSFSVIEADLDDPANRLFKASLATIDPESLKQPGPKLIPVFARCRGLALLRGEEIDAEVFQEITYFLVGPCSCRVKELNPGFDLLAPFPWDWVLYEETDLAAVMKQLPRADSAGGKNRGAAK
jgi:hypothetical protein